MTDETITIDNQVVTAEQVGGVITAQRGHVQALAFAAKGGAGLSGILRSVWQAKAAERKGPLAIFCYLLNNYTEEERVAIPVVGSKKGESGNKPYDRYTTTVKSDKGMKSVPGSWYTDTIRATSEYQYLQQVIDWLKGSDDVETPDLSAMPEDYRTVTPATDRAAELIIDLTKAKADMRAALVRGCQLYLHAEEIGAINPDRIKVKMPFRKDAQTQEIVVGGNTNIRLQDPMEGGLEDKILSVSEFLLLDTAKLKGPNSEQTVDTVFATKARQPRGSNKAGTTKQSIPVPTTVNDFVNYAVIQATAVDESTEQGQNLLTKLTAAVAANNEEVIMAIGALCMATDGLWNIVQGPYNKLINAKAHAQNAKANSERLGKATATTV